MVPPTPKLSRVLLLVPDTRARPAGICTTHAKSALDRHLKQTQREEVRCVQAFWSNLDLGGHSIFAALMFPGFSRR